MTPKEEMIIICTFTTAKQKGLEDYVIRKLENFLQTAQKDDLEILNYSDNYIYDYPGLWLSAQIIMLLGTYGNKFYNRDES